MSAREKLKKIVLPIMILVIGFALMRFMVLARPAPQKEAKAYAGALAEVMRIEKRDHPVQVIGTGTVQARREVNITPQVSGRITAMAPNFVAGGFFSKGERLFSIEDVDYKLAVDRARAALAQAELDLAREESNARIARLEWDALGGKNGEAPHPLVVYEPQMKKARAAVSSARASLKQAQLDLKRTRMTAPFNCRMRSEEIDLGQYVRAGTSVGTLAGTDTAEIVLPLPLDEMQWLAIPRQGAAQQGSPAQVRVKAGARRFTWPGRVVRSLGEVDPQGRMARVVVAVDDPYHLNAAPESGRPDLAVGMFVEVAIQGDTLSDVFSIPRGALRENDTVWVVGEEEKLEIRKVDVVRRDRKNVLIRDHLSDGDRVVLTALQGAANGMKLRPREQGAGS
jgi:RND family efflux transporter MFP subunit